MNKMRRVFLLLLVFSLAMGFFEAVVVIYLRMLYYPGGFQFPLVPVPAAIARIEFLREGATIIMLITAGMLAGKTRAQRFAFFLFCFGVWDIFFYAVLKFFVDWPPSLLTWDILFLIPVPWVGPVLTPCIVSLTMISFALSVIYNSGRTEVKVRRMEWGLFGAGGLILILSFTWDYTNYVLHHGNNFWTPLNQQAIFNEVANYVPVSFNWLLFTAGELLVITAIVLNFRKQRKNS